jgi:hypothetical protein
MQQIHTFLNRSDIILLTWSGIVSILCITSQGADMIGKEAEAKALNGFYQKTVAKNLIPLRKVTAKLLPPARQTKVLRISGIGLISASTAPASSLLSNAATFSWSRPGLA